MSEMSNNLSIYLIVLFNAACQAMLIWKLKLDKPVKWGFCTLGMAVPLMVMATMRLMVALGVVHGRVAQQVGIERFLTSLASLLLIVGPLIATGAAVIYGRKQRSLAVMNR